MTLAFISQATFLHDLKMAETNNLRNKLQCMHFALSEISNRNFVIIQAKGEQVVEAKVVGDDLRHWKGKIFGPVSKFFGYQSCIAFI